ncbi:MAG: hypothetical protein WB579_06540 [Bryobacteraceae bacterium]
MNEPDPPEAGKLAEGGESDVIAQFGEFSSTDRFVGICEPFTSTVMLTLIGEEEVFARMLNGTVTEVVEAVPEVAPVKLTGEGACTCQVQPVPVKFIVKLLPLYPADVSNHASPVVTLPKTLMLLNEHCPAQVPGSASQISAPAHALSHCILAPPIFGSC